MTASSEAAFFTLVLEPAPKLIFYFRSRKIHTRLPFLLSFAFLLSSRTLSHTLAHSRTLSHKNVDPSEPGSHC